GKNFAPETELVLGDNLVTDFTVESATQISFRVPGQNNIGNRTLTVKTRGGVDQKVFTILPKSLSELADGEITSVAGGLAYVGDGGLATSANISLSAKSVAIDGAGNIFIVDFFNNRIRK